MGSNKRMFRFLKYDLVKSIGAFWLVILTVNVLSGVMAFSMNTNSTIGPMIADQGHISFVGANFFAAFVFFIVYGLEMYYENFSLAIGFGGTRKNFYLNVIINNIIVVLIFATLQAIFLKLEYYIISKSAFNPIVEYGWFNILEDNILSIILILSFVFLMLASITNLLGVLQYRFSYKFWISLGVFVLLIQTFTNFIGRCIEIFINYVTNLDYTAPSLNLVAVGILIILAAYSIGFLLIRKANIK